jgi:hypothetical protein
MSKKASAKRFRILDSKHLGQVTGGVRTIDRGLESGDLPIPPQTDTP